MENQKYELFRRAMRDRRVTVLGIGISNLPLIRFLCGMGAQVTARDRKSAAEIGAAADELRREGVSLILGEGYLDDLDGDYIFKTPGMRFDLPQLCAARERGSIVTSEMEVFFDLCPAPIIAVTGSDGKTTTTTLIYEIMTASGYRCHLGGNIGKPLLSEIEAIAPEDYAIVELSSFQLHTMHKSPHIAVVTNLSPNHLDVHKSYEEYIDAKRNILRHQAAEDIVVLNAENEQSIRCKEEARGIVRTFGYGADCDVYEKDGMIYRGEEAVLATKDITIPGQHNVQNYMAAIAATADLARPDAIVRVARAFGGVPHRIELVREKDGVRYYNSSIDSSPNRTINTLRVFDRVILIAGGKDKGIPYDDLGPVMAEKVKKLFLIGKTGPVIAESLRKTGADIPIVFCESYEEVVAKASAAAEPGDVVLLSNASTSFDMFRNFEERGNLFKKLVNQL